MAFTLQQKAKTQKKLNGQLWSFKLWDFPPISHATPKHKLPTNHANPPDFAKDRVIFLETLQQEKGREVRLSSGDYGGGETIKQEHCDLGFRDSLLFLAAGTIFLANPMLTSSLGPSCHCTPMGET